MKNKEFIKKSIEANIVDHAAVLNSLRAKAAVLEATRASKRPAGLGLKKAAVFAVLAALCVTCISSSAFVIEMGIHFAPPADVSSSEKSSSVQNNNKQTASEASAVVNSGGNTNPRPDESREPKSESSGSEIIIEIPLDGEAKAFFYSFSENFSVLQSLLNARLDSSGADYDGYARVSDNRFKKVNDIKSFLYSFMKPEAAGEIYAGLTCGALPYYKEKDGALYQRTGVKDNLIIGIHTQTAFLMSQDEDTLVVNALLETSGEQNYYHRFEFVRANGEWLYSEVWKIPGALTNNTNNK